MIHSSVRASLFIWSISGEAERRCVYQRAMVVWRPGGLVARTTGSQSSSRLLSMVGANALLHIPPGEGTLAAGFYKAST